MQQTRKAPKVAKFKGKSELRGGLNLEGNVSPRAILTKDGIKKVNVKTANALLELGSIIDLGKGVFLDADIAASAFGGEVGDEFRYGDIGLDEVGIGIGKKVGDSGQIGLKGTYRPGRFGEKDDYTAGLTFSSKFNKGGAVDMQQMKMFNEGGLKDEGGTKDPVSGNEVPSGSLQEEVRDDIDAKLSPGEFVFPADVTRFLGLRFLMKLRDEAKAGLQRMEDMGQMGNSEEAVLDDDVPFEPTDLIIMAGPPEGEMNKMNTGGMPTQQQQSNQAGGVPGQGRFDQIVGQPQFEYEIKKFRNDAGGELFIPFVRGNPVYQPPLGYKEVTETQQQEELADPTLPQATVETELGSGELGGGPDAGDRSVGEMSPTEKADLGQFNIDNPMAANISEFVGNIAETQMRTGFPAPVVSTSAGVLGSTFNLDDDATLTDIGKSILGFGTTAGTKGKGTRDREALEKARNMRATNPKAFAREVEKYSKDMIASIDDSLAGYSNATVAAAKDTTFGASPSQMAAHAQGVGRGDRPEGSSPNDAGGYTTIGTNTPFGYSTNRDGEVDYNQTQRDKQKQREKDRAKGIADVLGGLDTPEARAATAEAVSQQEQSDQAGGVAGQDDPDTEGTGAGSATGVMNIGGLATKSKKKKQKRNKRSGLASR